MSMNSEKLYALMPAIHRLRDSETSGPLRELLDVIASQIDVIEEDLEQLYDDQFVETCAPWVVPYIGDLIGYRSLHHDLTIIASPRAEVANTIRFRRRKGTASMLEQLARDVSGWPARAVEFFQLLQTTQFMNHARPGNALTPDLRRWDMLERLDTPFDTVAHSVDTRRIASGEGRHNIPNVGVFLWRLGAHRVRHASAFSVDARRFLFSPLGQSIPLFTRDVREQEITHLAEPLNVPGRISRRQLFETPADYYGEDKSLVLDGVALADVVICNLSDAGGGWAHTPSAGKVAIDPELGRIAFGDAQTAAPKVMYHYGFSAEIGGGEYERASTFSLPLEPVNAVSAPATLQNAIDTRNGTDAIEIADNGRYEETLGLAVGAGERCELRAANERRPTIALGGDFIISGGDEHADVIFNGLQITGGRVRVTGQLRRLRLCHSTLVPGIALRGDGTPNQPGEASVVIESPGVLLEIDHSITGALQLHPLARCVVTDSIVDANAETAVAIAAPSVVAPGSLPPAAGVLRIEDSTIIGQIHTEQLELCSNALLVASNAAPSAWPAPIVIERRQAGCVRFSYVPSTARTPSRFRCQPDLEIATQIAAAARAAHTTPQSLPTAAREAIRRDVVAWMKPAFTSLRYGEPAYGQLRTSAPQAIREGADDEASMGAFHDLFEPQRATNVRVRLEEYLRLGLEVGVFYVT